jgi:hypothetical protein
MAKREKTATVQLKLRIREDLRRKLEKVAAGRDVSLNQEMADRLLQSFENTSVEALMEVVAGGAKHDVQMLSLVAGLMRANPRWKTDPEKQARLLVAFPLFVKFCVTGALTDADVKEAMNAAYQKDPKHGSGSAGATQASVLTGEGTREFLKGD